MCLIFCLCLCDTVICKKMLHFFHFFFTSTFYFHKPRAHANMEPGSLNRLKDTKKACKNFFFLCSSLFLPCLDLDLGEVQPRTAAQHALFIPALFTLLSSPCICADLKVLCVSPQPCCLYSSTPGLQSVGGNMKRCVRAGLLAAAP